MRTGCECHYQRYTSTLAAHHPFISKKVEYSIAQLPPLINETKITEVTTSLRVSLKALLYVASMKKQAYRIKYSVESTDFSFSQRDQIPRSLASIDTPVDIKSSIYKRRIVSIGSSALQDAIVGCDTKSRKQLKVVKTLEDGNDKTNKPSIDFDSDNTPGILPFIEVIKKSVIMQTQGSNSSRIDSPPQRSSPIKSGKLSKWNNPGDCGSPTKKDRQIQEVLERIVQRDKEARELSGSVLMRQSIEGAKFSRTKTIENSASNARSLPRKVPKFNFATSRQSPTHGAPKLKLDRHLVSVDIEENSESQKWRKLSLANKTKDKVSSKFNSNGATKKFKVVSAKTREASNNKQSTQEGGTISTQDY